MSKRITGVIVAIVIGTMLLAALGTTVASRVSGRRQEMTDLRDRASAIAELIPNVGSTRRANSDNETTNQTEVLRKKLVTVLGLSGVYQYSVGPRGRVTGEPPGFVPAEELDIDALRAGEVVDGSRGNVLWAAAARVGPNGLTTVAVVTRTREPWLAPTIKWLLVSATVAIALGVAVSIVLGRRLARPVREAVVTTRRIAAGDLSARLAVPGGTAGFGADADDGDELAELASSINAMADELERSRALDRQFLMSVSHDLRTPLTSIRGYAEAIVDGMSPSPESSAQVILDQSHRLERLVEDLLDLAKLDARQFKFRPVDVPVADVVQTAVDAITPMVANAGLRLHVDDTAEGVAHVDVNRLSQAIGNLSANAINFARTTVWISTARRIGVDGAPIIAIDVADDGPGIASEDLPHVFDRLYQANTSAPASESGSGLGLAIVKELVEAMGGTVTVSSVPGTGTTFSLSFPLA